jgi:amidophosphoribosyltransferase
MSDPIRHECGVALVRLLKPLEYYQEKYDSALWGFYKLFLLMEKQHNRGQDGAGAGCLKLNMPKGEPYLVRERAIKRNPLDAVFRTLGENLEKLERKGLIDLDDAASVKENFDFGGEVLMGHLRYATSGSYRRRACHPYVRRNNWPTKTLMLAGNFNMTNSDELNNELIAKGQHPIFDTDTQAILEELGFHLDEQHDARFRDLRKAGELNGAEIAERIALDLDPLDILRRSAPRWDGGYSIVGLIGNGDVFAIRDPNGIRPLFCYKNEEVIAFASERAPLMTVFDATVEQVTEVDPGQAIVVKANGDYRSERFADPAPRTSCSFERIYFSRGNDPDIYAERKSLGGSLAAQIMPEINHDLDRTVFSFIPNTAEIAFFGLMDQLRVNRRQEVRDAILEAAGRGAITAELLDQLILGRWPHAEKVAIKDIKLRTFISEEKSRNQLASHVYDVSYGSVRPGDNLVCIDDSIVRGTTLKKSIIKILSRLQPRRIVIASTAPQIRYPDCYGIDMSQLSKFIAFQAAVELLKDHGKTGLLYDVYFQCKEQVVEKRGVMENYVRQIYDRFTPDEIAAKIAELVTPKVPDWHGDVRIVFQTIDNLHAALPNAKGDWYFTGNYPTPGGYRVLNQAYINWWERKGEDRSY